MKLLFDANLSPRLVKELEDTPNWRQLNSMALQRIHLRYYSSLRAITGSTDAARRAGTQQASSPAQTTMNAALT